MKKLNTEKIRRYGILAICVAIVGFVSFGGFSIYHYRYSHYHAESVRIDQAQHQTNMNIYKSNKK